MSLKRKMRRLSRKVNLRKFSRQIKSVVRSPVLLSVAGGLAVVFPVVGVPALAAIAAANAALKAAEASKAQAQKLKKMLVNTKTEARKGNPGAIRALTTFKVVSRARRGDRKAVMQVRRIVRANSVGATIGARYRVQRDNGRLRRVA